MWNEKGSALVGYWVQYVTLTFDLTHDLGCFKVKFRNSSISGIVGLIDVKWKGSELIWYWADCMTLPFDHTHDLDLRISRSESETALSQEWGGQLTWNEKDLSHPFMTMILTSVTMVGRADVPDSDWGDFRQRADGISSSWNLCVRYLPNSKMVGHLMKSLWICEMLRWSLCCILPKFPVLLGLHFPYFFVNSKSMCCHLQRGEIWVGIRSARWLGWTQDSTHQTALRGELQYSISNYNQTKEEYEMWSAWIFCNGFCQTQGLSLYQEIYLLWVQIRSIWFEINESYA